MPPASEFGEAAGRVVRPGGCAPDALARRPMLVMRARSEDTYGTKSLGKAASTLVYRVNGVNGAARVFAEA